MTRERFNEIIKDELRHVHKTLILKGGDYAPGHDRLAAFKMAAQYTETTPAEALWGMASKHFSSIGGYLKSKAFLSKRRPLVQEKVTDSIGYLLLLWALFLEIREPVYEGKDAVSEGLAAQAAARIEKAGKIADEMNHAIAEKKRKQPALDAMYDAATDIVAEEGPKVPDERP